LYLTAPSGGCTGLSISGNQFLNNSASGDSGGAIFLSLNSGSTLPIVLANNLFSGNTSAAFGGAVYATGGNASSSLASGGNTFLLNTAVNNGGAVFTQIAGTVSFTNDVFGTTALNGNTSSANGGAIFAQTSASFSITGSS